MHTVPKQNTGRVCWSGFVLLELVSVAAAGCGGRKRMGSTAPHCQGAESPSVFRSHLLPHMVFALVANGRKHEGGLLAL